MNGAAVNSQQDQALHAQHNDSSSLHSPGYLLQTNYPCQEKNSQHQYSKAMNYNLLPDNFSVDGSSQNSQYIDSYSSGTRNRISNSGDIRDSRVNPTRVIREPMELPVPRFEVDENSVGVFTYKKDKSSSVQDSKDLDLDTRIDLLIKSKALSGMHPIFSDLNESEDSSTDSEEPYSDLSTLNSIKHVKVSLPTKHVIHQESFDDPEKPLSRPPSPFLSRATYLFWFNKAIELKQQAKAQEQALLEKATKKLAQGNLSSGKVSKTCNYKEDSNLLKNLLSELSKELKQSVKQDFIKEIFENTVLNSLEDWWIKEKQLEEEKCSRDFSMVSSTTNDILQLNEKAETNEPTEFTAKEGIKVPKSKRSISLKSENKNQKSKKNIAILENQATNINELNKSQVNENKTDVWEGLTAEHKSGSCKENGYLGSKRLNESCTFDDSSLSKSSPFDLEKVDAVSSINKTDDSSDIRNNASNNELFIEKSNGKICQDIKNELNGPVKIEKSNNHQKKV